MEKVKCVFRVFEVLLSIWILYRSGKIVSNKGNTDEEIGFWNNDMVFLASCGTCLLTNLWRDLLSSMVITYNPSIPSWIATYSSATYLIVYLMKDLPPIWKKIISIFWSGAVIVFHYEVAIKKV